MMVNEIKIEGLIAGEQPALKSWPSGDQYMRMSVTWEGETGKNGKKRTSTFSVVLMNDLAVKFEQAKVWKKGRRVLVFGSLRVWKSKDGRWFTDIVCSRIEFPDNMPAGAESKIKPAAEAKPAPAATPKEAANVEEDAEEVLSI